MIDSSKTPVPVWKRYATIALLAVLIFIAAYVVYTKELHLSSAATTPAPAPVAKAAQAAHTSTTEPASTPTTIPGGVPISSRNPFQ